jgi:hypothetical protein
MVTKHPQCPHLPNSLFKNSHLLQISNLLLASCWKEIICFLDEIAEDPLLIDEDKLLEALTPS